jgi:hypothetical protein
VDFEDINSMVDCIHGLFQITTQALCGVAATRN